jgi:hypothetical protein
MDQYLTGKVQCPMNGIKIYSAGNYSVIAKSHYKGVNRTLGDNWGALLLTNMEDNSPLSDMTYALSRPCGYLK